MRNHFFTLNSPQNFTFAAFKISEIDEPSYQENTGSD